MLDYTLGYCVVFWTKKKQDLCILVFKAVSRTVKVITK